jgi:hypothetical protein
MSPIPLPLQSLGWFEIPLGDLERAEAFFGQPCHAGFQHEVRRIERITLAQAIGGFGHFVDCERPRATARGLL